MGGFIKGDVVVVPFPFSDLSASKRRPALVLAAASANDLILAQITSRSFFDEKSIEIDNGDFADGRLRVSSNVRPNKLFTAESNIIAYKAGHLKTEKMKHIIDGLVQMLLYGT